ncbi:MAG: 30S ribosomal protein S8 [Deltaproteobacteria bacterium]|nr:30S ribosomal protein S8 [Deltaproteobacteria bacterium]MBI3017096.1 30S ribosomal protein S8 [Deltaproteobacteria bacterium]
MVTDSIGDLLTRIRNANLIYQESLELPFSKLKWEMVQLLKKEGFLKECILSADELGRKNIKLALKYGSGRRRVISGIRRVSKPGRRIYSSLRGLKPYRKGFGVTLLSTPNGVLTDRTATQQKVGGEVLCMVW